MKRKKSEVPARIWSFFVKPPSAEDMAKLEPEFSASHKYRNELIAIERTRRDAIRTVQLQFGDLTAQQQIKDSIKARIDALYETIKAVQQRNRSSLKKDPEIAAMRVSIKNLKAVYKVENDKFKSIREKINKDPTALAQYAVINDQANTQHKLTRCKYADCYWGTRELVDKAHEAIRASRTPPEFKKWRTASSRIGARHQSAKDRNGITQANITSNTVMRILPAEALQQLRQPSTKLEKFKTLRMRVNTVPGTIQPVWVDFHVLIHRPLPDDFRIKNAWIKRTPIGETGWIKDPGRRYRWELQMQLESMTFTKEVTSPHAVAVDIGWRKQLNGAIRVGFWADTQGESGPIDLPAEIISLFEKAEGLQSTRTKNFNDARDELHAWSKEHPDILPQWFIDTITTKALYAWKSIGRLAARVWYWRENRFPGDETIYKTMYEWVKQDRHLLQWVDGNRMKAQDKRMDLYRKIALDFSRRYSKLILEDFDLREIAKDAKPEDKKDQERKAVRRQRRNAAPSELRQCLREKLPTITVASENTSKLCSHCGQLNDIDEKTLYICNYCNTAIDRDRNAAKNILARGFASDPLKPVAKPDEKMEPLENAG